MSTVLATGTVLLDGDRPVLVPTGPDMSGHVLALELRGQDLPPHGTRAAVEGELTGRSLRVVRWRPEPHSTSAWGRSPQGAGVAPEDAKEVMDGVSEDWPIISVGEARTSGDRRVVVLEVEQITPEIAEWLQRQPAGAVQVIPFISPRPSTTVGDDAGPRPPAV